MSTLIKFKKRTSTDTLYAVVKNCKDLPLIKLFRMARMEGSLDTGYHIILHRDGTCEYDRQIDAVADYEFKNYDTSIYILVDTTDIKHLTDAQRIVLSELKEDYKLPLKIVEG